MLFSAIISFTVSVTKAIVTLGLAAEGLTAIGNALTAIGKALGLIRPETQVENLGDQALQAEEAGITPDAFDAYEDYVKAVESFQLDPEKSKQFTPEEKVKKGSSWPLVSQQKDFPKFLSRLSLSLAHWSTITLLSSTKNLWKFLRRKWHPSPVLLMM